VIGLGGSVSYATARVWVRELGRRLTIDVLAQRDKLILLLRQFGKGVVSGVGLGFERHVPSVAVELPHESWIALKGLGSC